MWHHYRSQGRRWPFYWFTLNAGFYCIAMLVLGLALRDREPLFVGLALGLIAATLAMARRGADEAIGKRWWALLLGTMALCGGYMKMMVYWPDGDTPVCYDRVRQAGFRGPMINHGPDPYCRGVPFREL